jgi:hypothetical protein
VKYLPGDTGSMDVHYNFPAGQHVYHLDPYPNDFNALQIPLLNGNQAPVAVGLWVKGNPSLLSGPNFAPGVDTYSIGFYQADNTTINFHPGTITSDGWTFITAPLRVNYVSNVVINPPTNESGDVYFSDLEALYSPRPVTTATYQPLPQNPSWLQFERVPWLVNDWAVCFGNQQIVFFASCILRIKAVAEQAVFAGHDHAAYGAVLNTQCHC